MTALPCILPRYHSIEKKLGRLDSDTQTDTIIYLSSNTYLADTLLSLSSDILIGKELFYMNIEWSKIELLLNKTRTISKIQGKCTSYAVTDAVSLFVSTSSTSGLGPALTHGFNSSGISLLPFTRAQASLFARRGSLLTT